MSVNLQLKVNFKKEKENICVIFMRVCGYVLRGYETLEDHCKKGLELKSFEVF